MALAKAALKLEPTVETGPVAEKVIRSAPALPGLIPPRLPNALAGTEQPKLPVATMQGRLMKFGLQVDF